jgi:LuxR family transcriptional regulator, maltose regulon positive regulatory protein
MLDEIPMMDTFPALLVTKLTLPRVRAGRVARSVLLAQLDAGSERRLMLITAGAGFGKTSLVAEWCSTRTEHVAWVALDEGDNDPARFLSYVVAAIQMHYPQVGRELLVALQSQQPPLPETALTILINQLIALEKRLFLVLDDYHLIENATLHSALAFLLDHCPPHLTLILLTRAEPPLPLAKWRAKNDLLEIRADKLRFSPDEAAHFLTETMQLALSAADIQALEQRTEGWIAGLQLAAIALQSHHSDAETFIRNFTGSHRFVLDYLIEEVLARQPDDVRRFLLQTSLLHRLNEALCDAVTGDASGAAMLTLLEKNNVFLIPMDETRRWYRYHHLFADLLQAWLYIEYPDLLNALRQRAAHWHADNHLPEDAIGYALAAGDFALAAQLITGAAVGVTQRGEAGTLLNWYRAFPPDFVDTQPRLNLYFMLAFALNGRWDDAFTLLARVEAHQREQEEFTDEERWLAAYVALVRQNRERLDQLLHDVTPDTPIEPAAKLLIAVLLSVQGDMQRASEWMTNVQATSEREGNTVLALTAMFHQCRFTVFLGRLETAHTLAQAALQHMGDAVTPMATIAHTTLGRVYIEWGEFDRAEQHLQHAIRIAELTGFVTGIMASATLMLAEVAQGRGKSAEANSLMQSAIAYAERNDPPTEGLWLKIYQARIALLQGNVAAASDILREAQPELENKTSLFYPTIILQVTQARVWLWQRRHENAITLLTHITTEAPENLLTVEVWGVLALARMAHGDSVHALLALEQALMLAEPERRTRVFVELGAPMAKLLARFAESQPDHPYAQTLLKLLPAPEEDASTPDPLSERELEILRLIVAGHSNDEIASTLILALSTVKWYINVLYGKLHVKTRSQAIARAHALRLVE